MKQIKHIIWDWNGTILDDAWLCVEIVNSMLSKRNLPVTSMEEYSELFDFPVIDYYKKIGFDFCNESFEDLSIEFMAAYETRKYECKLHSHFSNAQPIIKSKDIKQSILSAYAQNYLVDSLSYFNILSDFTRISGLKHILADSKIDNARNLIEQIDIPRENCLFIGDTVHDIDAAEAMDIEYCLIPSGHNSLKRLYSRSEKIILNTNQLLNKI